MKIAIFSDLHLGLKQNSPVWHKVALDWCDNFVSILKKRNINTIVFLGDFFHHRNSISVHTLHVANEFLDKLSDFNLHIIFGNHDLYYHEQADISALNLLKNKNNINVYDKPQKLRIGERDVIFSGWGYDSLKYKGDILFTHAEINLFKLNEHSVRSDSPLKSSDLLKNYKLVYSGHFHYRQNRYWGNKRGIEYIGNPFSMDFGDGDNKKGFAILDLDTLETEFIENNNSPKFKKALYSEIKNNSNLKQDIYGNVYKLIVDEKIELSELNTLINRLNDFEPLELLVEWDKRINNQYLVENKEVNSFNIEDIIKEYIDLLELEEDNKISATNYILNLYGKVNSL